MTATFFKHLVFEAVPLLFAAKPRVDGIRAVSKVHGSAASSAKFGRGTQVAE